MHVADVFAIELTVYPRLDLRSRPRSSTDGKPIVRNSVRDVEALLASEHAASWERYCEDGSVDGMDSVLDALDAEEAGEVPGPYDGFVADGVRVVDEQDD